MSESAQHATDSPRRDRGSVRSRTKCLDRRLTCVFSTEADNRGSAPKSQMQLLQNRVNLLEQTLQVLGISIDVPDGSPTSPSASLQGRITAAIADHTTPPALRTASAGSACLRGQDTSRSSGGGQPGFYGSTSGRPELQSRLAASTEPHDPLVLGDTGSGDGVPRDAVRRDVVTSDSSPSTQDVPELPTHLVDHLVETYFEWEQPWFQVVDRKLFFESRRDGGRYFSSLLLYCILAIASRYSPLEQVRTDAQDTNTAGLGFLQQAEALLQVDLKWPSITTIQSLTIMAIMYVAIGSDASGWLHHGMAIRLVLDMGLNLDASSAPGSSSLTAEDIQLRHQIYWSLYCSDKLWATYTGRVCTMLDYQGSVPLPSTVLPATVSAASSDSNETITSPVSILRELSTHCVILEKILTTLYAPNKTVLDAEKYSFFDMCLMTLRGWYHSLPDHVGLDTREQQNSQRSPHVHILHMVYHTSIILLCKPFITNKPLGESDTAPELHHTAASDVRRKASAMCREAAKEICLITERYRETFGSFRQSPLTATHCTLMAILVTLHGEDSRAYETSQGARKGLKTAMKTLEELSDSWTPPRRYWHTMNQALRIDSPSIENQDAAEGWQESREALAPAAAGGEHRQSDGQQEVPLNSQDNWVSAEPQGSSSFPLTSDDGVQHATYFNIDDLELTAFEQLPSDYMTLESLGFDLSFSI
ncbi:uncharacterized protein NECHADRAFT_75680 [Fusarium vanettenii 77-13-4]|uniref:Xylanolytic transcriptional activator regulatory domain-containing protein n=1 Tax=Fusarium vanettenii (strain ATCC MYA-4622 / CBS 123669 / FGSC 9596 / NRRL 45880 / 77-13-4) TaxID=660122 RepID=C7YJH5_FUSV7|nr:uncharacterized protein NECHADRAFT_75680 [Fusarium vanettenii 77-13-4]EEU48974.1 hypothetical protein NECHADRAFT_75680 [Fusarium vanettenii 77-13-4]